MTFGWNYPPGAETDPNAPYNQPESTELYCDTCEELVLDYAEGDPCPYCDSGMLEQ